MRRRIIILQDKGELKKSLPTMYKREGTYVFFHSIAIYCSSLPEILKSHISPCSGIVFSYQTIFNEAPKSFDHPFRLSSSFSSSFASSFASSLTFSHTSDYTFSLSSLTLISHNFLKQSFLSLFIAHNIDYLLFLFSQICTCSLNCPHSRPNT